MAKHKEDKRLWSGISESDFLNEDDIDVVGLADYNLENMRLFAGNTNIFRQIPRLSDSLKPVERRILYSLYKLKSNDSKIKSTIATGKTMEYHGHGDASIYGTMVGMAQLWKRQCTLIDGKGNFGNAVYSDVYGHQRYTGVVLSKYARECFFDEYDEDCVETIFNSACDEDEPMTLPSKFPNILINGGMGIVIGNIYRIPSYNVHDVVRVCKNVIRNKYADVMMIPDLPSGCSIVDDGHSFRDIIDTGAGIMKMRADYEIFETHKYNVIKIKSLPWLTSFRSIDTKLTQLAEKGILPIKDTQDHSYQVENSKGELSFNVDYRILIDKNVNPHEILMKIYNLTELQKTVAIDFKVVLDDLTTRRLTMKELILSWVDSRRSYKRRLFNKKLTKLSARVSYLEVLLHILEPKNLEKVIKIIRKCSSEKEIAEKVLEFTDMTSYQASKIAAIGLGLLNGGARQRTINELERVQKEMESILDIISDSVKIDELIIQDLDDLKKYGSPRKSQIVTDDENAHISDTSHYILTTNENYIKKLAYDEGKTPNIGAFKQGDFPTDITFAHNTESIVFVDNTGRYSTIPVHKIDSCDNSSFGTKIFDLCKLNGKVIKCLPALNQDLVDNLAKEGGKVSLLNITKRGYGKKTPLEAYMGSTNSNNIRMMKVREDDSLIVSEIVFDKSIILIYTKNGNYNLLKMSDVTEQTKTSMGVITMRVDDDDEVLGIAIIGKKDQYLSVLTERGMVKKVDLKYFGSAVKRTKISDQGSLINLDKADSVKFVHGMRDKESMIVTTRDGVTRITGDDIPSTTKISKGRKLVPSSKNSYIISVSVQ